MKKSQWENLITELTLEKPQIAKVKKLCQQLKISDEGSLEDIMILVLKNFPQHLKKAGYEKSTF